VTGLGDGIREELRRRGQTLSDLQPRAWAIERLPKSVAYENRIAWDWWGHQPIPPDGADGVVRCDP